MNLTTIVITWMDGRVIIYENSMANVLNGVLHVHVYKGVLDKSWHFPISNIRAWGPEEWGGEHGLLMPDAAGHLKDSAHES